MAPILEGVQTSTAQTKKLEEEKAKGREAPIDHRPESSKRPKVRHTDKAMSLEEQRKFFNLRAKQWEYKPQRFEKPEQLDKHDHDGRMPELNGNPDQNQPTPMPDDESESDEGTPESDEESDEDEEIPPPDYKSDQDSDIPIPDTESDRHEETSEPVAEVIQSEAMSEPAEQPVKQIIDQSGN
ncbi:hypothetical protein ABVK25_002722 [Lepraria finkii]|uniref:Uncharacterized protein n=1 Tax=Lepraria finkii TaxID=1340010 RepID=A0ABR4BGM6_9LECA